MSNDKKSNKLSILIAFLLVLMLFLALMIFYLRVPDWQRIDEKLFAVQQDISSGRLTAARRDLLLASRYAMSAEHWQTLLDLASQLWPEDRQKSDYKLFATLSERASASIPGSQEFLAYMAWSNMRMGNTKKALKSAERIFDKKFYPIKAEVLIAEMLTQNDKTTKNMLDEIKVSHDPQFLGDIASLTGSAEFTVNTALAYMERGDVKRAYQEAQKVMSGERNWLKQQTPYRHRSHAGLARIAYDAYEVDNAATWLTDFIREGRERRVVFWEDIQFLGDIYWQRYLYKQNIGDLYKARDLWYEALDIVYPNQDVTVMKDSWKLWVNLAVLENMTENSRKAEELLAQALLIFPAISQVKASWVRQFMDTYPAVARRMLNSDENNLNDAVLAITSIKLDPDAITPRLYEMKLWQFFNHVTFTTDPIYPVDRQEIITFLLEYMTSRNSFSSVDIAIDRYRKVFPADIWLLSWRLGVDVTRRMPTIDLIAESPNTTSVYNLYRQYARNMHSWRAYHDSALFALLAAREMSNMVSLISEDPSKPNQQNMEAFILNTIAVKIRNYGYENDTLGDRLAMIEGNRSDLKSARSLIGSAGKKGIAARSSAKAAMQNMIKMLYENAIKDMESSLADASIKGEQSAKIYRLGAYIFQDIGESVKMQQYLDMADQYDSVVAPR